MRRYVGVDIARGSLEHFADKRIIPACVDAAAGRSGRGVAGLVAQKYARISQLVAADMAVAVLDRDILPVHQWNAEEAGGLSGDSSGPQNGK